MTTFTPGEWCVLWSNGKHDDCEFFDTREEAVQYLLDCAPPERLRQYPYFLLRLDTQWPPEGLDVYRPPEGSGILDTPLRACLLSDAGEELGSTTEHELRNGRVMNVFRKLETGRATAVRFDFLRRSVLLPAEYYTGWHTVTDSTVTTYLDTPLEALREV